MTASTRVLLSTTAALALAGSPTTAANRLAAQHDAQRLLGRLILPPGSQRLTRPPASTRGLLAKPPSIPATSQLVDRHRLWRVHLPFARVVSFEKAHRPRGSSVTGWSTAGGPHYPANQGREFTFPAVAGRISSRALEVEIVGLPGGWTGIRADAQVIWVVTRPPSDIVPAEVREIDFRNPTRLLRRVTDPPQVARIRRWFDALPITQPGVVYHCPPTSGPLIRIEFLASGSQVVARARVAYDRGNSGPCNPVFLSIGGRARTPLVGGRFLLRVQRLVGVRFG